MRKYLRVLIFVTLVFGIIFLARNKVVWAGGSRNVLSQSGSAQLAGIVWNDADKDGIQDPGESGMPNVTVDLYDSSKTIVNTTVTDANGRYKFDGLTPGDYYVDFVPLAGYVFSPKVKDANEAVDSDADVISGQTVTVALVAGENTSKWDAGMYVTNGFVASSAPGTVKPPPAELTVCENGDFSVGGASLLRVDQLAPGYCLTANLWDHSFALGRIPDGAGKVLSDVTFLRVFYQGRFVYEVPSQDGSIEICYAVPPDTQAKIYFFDFFGPRFGKRTGQPSWEPLQTTVTDGVACAPAQTSGAYALIGQ